METLSEDEDDVIERTADSVSVSATYGSASEFTPTPGGPFSALTPSMWPQDIMVKLGNPVRTKFIIILRALEWFSRNLEKFRHYLKCTCMQNEMTDLNLGIIVTIVRILF